MKIEKIKQLFVLAFFFIIVPIKGQAQTTASGQGVKVAAITFKQKNNNAIYSFIPLTEYDEFKTNQRLQRINELTGDHATVVFKQNKIIVNLNPEKIKDEMLIKLLSAMTRSHGYDDFVVQH